MPHHPKYFSVYLQQTRTFLWYSNNHHQKQEIRADTWLPSDSIQQECPVVRSNQSRIHSRIECCIWPQTPLVSSSLEHPSNCSLPSQPWCLWREQPSFVESPTIWVYQVRPICQGQHGCDVMCIFSLHPIRWYAESVCPQTTWFPCQALPLQWISIWYLLGRYLETIPFLIRLSLYSRVYFCQNGLKTPVLLGVIILP